KLFGKLNETSSNVVVDADNSSDTSWIESTVTWANFFDTVTLDGTELAETTVTSTANAWYTWNVYSHVNPKHQQSPGSATTFVMYGAGNTNAAANFASKETGTTAGTIGTGTTYDPRLSITTLLAPTGLSGSATSPTSVSLSWTDASDNESGFKIERSQNGGSTWSTAVTATAGAQSATDTTAAPNTSYLYRIRSLTGSPTIESGPSATVPITTPPTSPPPPPPAGATVSLVPSDDTYIRGGTTNAPLVHDQADPDQLVVKKWSTPDATREIFLKFALADTNLPANATIVSATLKLYGKQNDSTATVNVIADTTNNGSWSESTLTWNTVYVDNVLTYDPASSIDSDQIGATTYQWHDWTVSSAVQDRFSLSSTSTITFALYGEANTAPYATFYSREYAQANDATKQPTLEVTSLLAPSNLSGTLAGSAASLSLTDNSTNETGFVIERLTVGTSTWETLPVTINPNISSYSDTTVVAGNGYTYRIRSKVGSVLSNPTNEQTVTVPPPPPPTN
ncbi:MAG TPA: DNRLRE domain-containing protein, partial [Roseimicrobium sp.]|nr:DNRLRE domain-containing protein [Roseimicrobium sp.]